MAGFSATGAIGSGFRLIAREPKTILIWIAAYAVFATVCYGLMFAAMPELLGFYQEMGRSALEGVEPDEAQAMAIASRMLAIAPVLVLAGLVAYAVMLGAIYRAVLHPEERRFGYLRFGRSELWLLLTMVVWCILMFVIYAVLVVVLSVLTGVAAGAAGGDASPAAFGGLFFVAIVAVVVFMLWIMLRLSLALPMSHDQGRFVIFESWTLTKGQSLKLLGVGVALVVIVWLIEMAVVGIVIGVLLGGAGGLEMLVSQPTEALAGKLLPLIPVFGLLAAVFGILMFTIVAAPIADIYRQLTAAAAAGEGI